MTDYLKLSSKEMLWDSNEEMYFFWYLMELKDASWIKEFEYHPEPFELTKPVYLPYIHKELKGRAKVEKTVIDEFAFIQGMTMEPDFRIIWDEKALGVFCKRYDTNYVNRDCFFFAKGDELTSYIDVKGAVPDFANGRSNSSAITFPVKQKIAYALYGTYVQKVVPVIRTKNKSKIKFSGLFVETFTPARYLLTDTGKQERKIEYNVKRLCDHYR